MIFTLHRYIFREVLKVFCLAAIALTLMMSLGSILRPVQEYGVGPGQVMHLMLYFLPITLTFVLPMAALFATTLIYGRFANDNELDACKASGISMLSLVYPGFVLAVIVAIANLLLSFYVTPLFIERAEKSFKNDARQILFRNIQRKGYYKLPGDNPYRIYADNADLKTDTLFGVVVAVPGDKGGIKKIITAEKANVAFNPHERFNEVRITAYSTHQIGLDEDAGFSAQLLSLSTEFGALLGDNVKFKKIDELKQIRSNPMLFDPVAKIALRAYARFTTELLAQYINETISRPGAFFRLYNQSQSFEISATSCSVRDEKRLQLTGDVVIIERDLPASPDTWASRGGQTGIPGRKLTSAKCFLNFEGDELSPTLTLDIRSAKWQSPQGTDNYLSELFIRGIIVPAAVTDRLRTPDILTEINPQAINAGLDVAGPSDDLIKLQKELQSKIDQTMSDIGSEIHSRLIFGVGCITLIMIGIGLGIILRGGHLLTAFAASSLPALVLISCIMMGKNIMENAQSVALSGAWLMWGGLIILTVLCLWLYRYLLKH
jgi:lipopolysaccharide export LptBFGC system permease protein LptF